MARGRCDSVGRDGGTAKARLVSALTWNQPTRCVWDDQEPVLREASTDTRASFARGDCPALALRGGFLLTAVRCRTLKRIFAITSLPTCVSTCYLTGCVTNPDQVQKDTESSPTQPTACGGGQEARRAFD